ncbi:hypothetical protein [Streptomyces roseoviridis]|uniref:Uncharacterized protein n=1 Tax=Streptomyces roseoviridis TaxID=67361 RepID=A0ABV5QXV7_9ACTN
MAPQQMLFVAVLFDPLSEQLQRLLLLIGVEVAVGADAEGAGVGLLPLSGRTLRSG